MKIFRRIFTSVADALIARVKRRPPDFVIGGQADPYLLRWYLTPWRRWPRRARRRPTRINRIKAAISALLPSVYLHKFLRDDDDRALHDHPWFWCSIILRGDYTEVIERAGITIRMHRVRGSLRCASPWRAHRIELFPWWLGDDNDHMPQTPAEENNMRAPAWTLFITGPRIRNWGFHCPRGWVPWQEFTAADDPGSIGRGCDA